MLWSFNHQAKFYNDMSCLQTRDLFLFDNNIMHKITLFIMCHGIKLLHLLMSLKLHMIKRGIKWYFWMGFWSVSKNKWHLIFISNHASYKKTQRKYWFFIWCFMKLSSHMNLLYLLERNLNFHVVSIDECVWTS